MEDVRHATYLASDAARVLGVTPGAIRAAVARGRIVPAAYTPGGVALYTLEEIERYGRERKRRRRPQGGAL